MPDPLDDPLSPGYDDPLVAGQPSPEDIASMTHRNPAASRAAAPLLEAETYRKAAPYLEAAQRFAHGGLTEAVPGLREKIPSAINAVGGLVQSQAARDAMSSANVGGLPLIEALGTKEMSILREMILRASPQERLEIEDALKSAGARKSSAEIAPAAPAAHANADVVGSHLSRLNAGGVDKGAFEEAMTALRSDPSVGIHEMSDIARQYTGANMRFGSKSSAETEMRNSFKERAFEAVKMSRVDKASRY